MNSVPLYQGEDAYEWLKHHITEEDDHEALTHSVQEIIHTVSSRQDEGLRELAARFGDPVPDSLVLTADQIEAAVARVPEATRAVLDRSAANIRAFGEAVMASLSPVRYERAGVEIGVDLRAVERAGCYVPGGRYPLPSTALMTALTARVAGVREICIVSPRLADEIVYAGTLAGVTRFHPVGGAQAVAALALGTESIPAVDMVVGPGNAYVTEAKRQLQGRVGIDMLAGPSEVAIIADAGANPEWVALDLLAQSEHDPRAHAYLLTDDEALARRVRSAIPGLVERLKLPAFLAGSLAGGALLVLPDLAACVDASNRIAPEHLQLSVADPDALKPRLHAYGALFMGYESTVPFGDYMAGPNHTLPTGRTARFSGGLSPLTFLRSQSWIRAGRGAPSLAGDTEQFARLEGLVAHAAAAAARK